MPVNEVVGGAAGAVLARDAVELEHEPVGRARAERDLARDRGAHAALAVRERLGDLQLHGAGVGALAGGAAERAVGELSSQTPPGQAGLSSTVSVPRTTRRSPWGEACAALPVTARASVAATGASSARRAPRAGMRDMGRPSGWGLWGGRLVEQLVHVEPVGLDDRVAVGVEPVGAGAVVVQLDPVAVGVVQVDGDGAAVVGGVIDRVTVVEQPAHGADELAAVGVR